jgi:hypothetical protein
MYHTFFDVISYAYIAIGIPIALHPRPPYTFSLFADAISSLDILDYLKGITVLRAKRPYATRETHPRLIDAPPVWLCLDSRTEKDETEQQHGKTATKVSAQSTHAAPAFLYVSR